MVKAFLKAKHWQLFMLLFGIPVLFEIVYMVRIFSRIHFHESMDTTMMFQDIWWLLIPVLFISMGTLYGWFWSIAFGLKDKMPSPVKLKTRWFKVFFFFSIIYIIIYPLLFNFAITQSHHYQLFLYILPFHFLAMFCMVYLSYFVAKTIKTIELQREVRFNDFISEFFLLWFSFVGVWVLQPKINQIAKGTFHYFRNNSTPSDPPVESSREKGTSSNVREYSYLVIQNKANGRKERITPEWWEETKKQYGDDKFDILHYLDANGDIINEEEDKKAFVRPPKSYLTQSILVTVFCCMPLGIVGIVNAANVESRFYAGDKEGAERASKEAKKWTNIGFWIGVSGIVLYIAFIIFLILMRTKNGIR